MIVAFAEFRPRLFWLSWWSRPRSASQTSPGSTHRRALGRQRRRPLMLRITKLRTVGTTGATPVEPSREKAARQLAVD